MAIATKNIPVLEGKTAEVFIKRAERLAKRKTPVLSESSQKQLQEVLERSKKFCF